MADIARIKSNVQKMLAQNAPEADIDAYLASEKVTPEQLRAGRGDYTIPAAPPGEIVHGAGGTSTVTGSGLTAQRSGDPQADAVALEALRQREQGRDLGDKGRMLAPTMQGLSFGFGDEAVSAGTAAARAAKGGNFANEYAIAQEIQKQELERQRQEHPVASAVGEIGGGVGSGLGMFGSGLTAMRFVPAGLQGAGRFGAGVLASGADAAAYGALTGAGQGEGSGRATGAGQGLLYGAALGMGLPVVGKAASALAAPIVNPIRARLAPESVAGAKLLQTYRRAGQEPQDVADALRSARAEGQGEFTVADALGHAGQRATSAVARIPQNERQALVNFLEDRQAGQGRRVASQIAEGFQAPQTAAQTQTRMEAARKAASDVNFANARQGAGPVDLTRTLTTLDQTLAPGITRFASPQTNIRQDSVEAVLTGIKSRLTDGRSNLTDFASIQRVRDDLSDAIEAAKRSGANNQVRLLTGVIKQLDQDMEAAAPGFLQANRVHAAHSRAIDAIDEGRTAATRGRPEDTIPAFRAMTPRAQEGYRAGYADPLIEQTQGAAIGVNKARPFTSDAFQMESAAVAPMSTGPRMQRQLGRENTMFETRNAALGGSRTADNLADSADVTQVDPAIISNLLTGNFGQAVRAGGNRIMSEALGMAPGVAERVTRALMERDPNQAIRHINAARRSLGQRELNTALVVRALMGGSLAALPAQ
jgi:hypothetical protein